MAIHHAVKSQADRLGFSLEERDKLVMAFHPKSAMQVFGVSAKDAVTQMTKMITVMDRDPDLRFQALNEDKRVGFIRDAVANKRSIEVGTPTELYKLWGTHKLRWVEPINSQWDFNAPDGTLMNADGTRSIFDDVDAGEDAVIEDRLATGDLDESKTLEETFEEDQHPKDPPTSDATAPIKRNDKGIPLDGATAYAEGIMAADNPFDEGSEEGDAWDAQWDQAADDAPEDTGGKTGSVVAGKYRTLYAERGHPTHCGDWLADLLNNYCVGKKETDLAQFEVICGLNGVNTAKYKRDGIGWQGRIRMTGRNLLAKRVFAAGKITLPGIGDEPEHTVDAPADWMAAQRFAKPATEAAK